eukprot:GGOE01000909.1.p1 GENE.GGOE01000909.1~~GGOE01000909.1.p1  ORF type:complete len:719 (-),score=193.41 GGOE01000909.1:253-2205(-)
MAAPHPAPIPGTAGQRHGTLVNVSASIPLSLLAVAFTVIWYLARRVLQRGADRFAVWPLMSVDAADNALPIKEVDAVQQRISLATSTDKLDLADCALEEVPSEVFDLVNLELLALNGNRLTSLPPAIGRLTKLRRLVVAGNQLRTLPPEIGHLTALEELFIHGNDLEFLPDALGNLCCLRNLCVSGNRLQALPSTIGNLQQLTNLTAGGNQLREVPHTFGGLRNLVLLHLHGNRLTSLPNSIGNCEALQELYVQGNYLTTLPATMAQLRALRELSIADNHITTLFEDWSQLQSLGLMYAYGNQLSHLPQSIATISSLRSLWLEGNPFDGKALVEVLSQMKAVRLIGVDMQAVAGIPKPALESCGNLTVGTVNSDAGRLPGYFKLQLQDPRCPADVLVVAFGSAPGVPNWGKLLGLVAAAATEEELASFDVLFVVDPLRQWYGAGTVYGSHRVGQHSTPGVQGQPVTGADFFHRIGEVAQRYKRTIFLGDSMGATGALLCAEWANIVIAFCPQLDFETASIRPRYDSALFRAMHHDIVEGVRRCRGRVTIHTGTWQHDSCQARQVEHLPNVELVVHYVDSHRLALALNEGGELLPLVRTCILQQARECCTGPLLHPTTDPLSLGLVSGHQALPVAQQVAGTQGRGEEQSGD